MRIAEEIVNLTYLFKKKTSARLLLAAFLEAFFGKVIIVNFKQSTRETTVAVINPFKLLSVATRRTFRRKYVFLTQILMYPAGCYKICYPSNNFGNINNIAPASGSLLAKIAQKKVFGSFQAQVNYRGKMAQVFQPRSIIIRQRV